MGKVYVEQNFYSLWNLWSNTDTFGPNCIVPPFGHASGSFTIGKGSAQALIRSAVQCLGSDRDLVENETILSHLHSSWITEIVHCIYVRSTSVDTWSVLTYTLFLTGMDTLKCRQHELCYRGNQKSVLLSNLKTKLLGHSNEHSWCFSLIHSMIRWITHMWSKGKVLLNDNNFIEQIKKILLIYSAT